MDALDHLRNHLFDIWQGQSAMDGITPNALWQFTPPPDDLIRQEIAPNPAAAATHLANLSPTCLINQKNAAANNKPFDQKIMKRHSHHGDKATGNPCSRECDQPHQ